MNPEDYLNRTLPPKPAPFLRQRILDQAQHAWGESQQANRFRRRAFHPLAAAASITLMCLLAFVTSEVDQRMTAALVSAHPGTEASAAEREPTSPPRENDYQETVFGAFAHREIARAFDHGRFEIPSSDRGT